MGTAWANSGQIERDNNDERAIGAEAEFFEGGTTTPLVVYEDAAETTPHANPVVADGSGRWPLVFIPFNDAGYDVRVTTSGGTELYYPRGIPNSDPVTASEDSVDATALLQTGDVIFSPKTGTRAGFVRLNGKTIGSATSGATERANADCEDLFLYNWNNFSNTLLAVSGGRGANAAADWAANKTIAVHDGRAAGLRGVDDMGNTAAGLLALIALGNATAGGSIAGANTHALVTGELASHTHGVNFTSAAGGDHDHTGATGSSGGHTPVINITDPGHQHTTNLYARINTVATTGATTVVTDVFNSGASSGATTTATTGITATANAVSAHTHTIAASGTHTHAIAGTSDGTGSGTAHNNVPRDILGNWLQKL